jgi:TetR/AcrR family transcriptional repressor of nem operon
MLQTDFGGKKGLFLEALDQYLDMGQRDMFGPMSQGDLDTVAQVFLARTKDAGIPSACYGCFGVNTATDENALGEEIQKRREKYFDLTHSAYREALKNEKKKGHLIDSLDIEQAASYLTSSIIGINMLIKVGQRCSAARPAAKMVVQHMMSWRK